MTTEEKTISEASPGLRILGTLKVGHLKPEKLNEAFLSKGFRSTKWAEAITKNSPMRGTSRSIMIGDISIKDLGHPKGTNLESIKKAISDKVFYCSGFHYYKLKLLIPEDAYHFCVQYGHRDFSDQLLRIAMEPVLGIKNVGILNPKIGQGEKVLDALYASRMFDPNGRFIFSLVLVPKKS